jgi:hypothetical protein
MCRVYIDVVKEALQDINGAYFKVPTTYRPAGIVRERVFCYELYHQIRARMDAHPLLINGEIDKRGHVDFRPRDRKNPDFVFHANAAHRYNTLVIEVKGLISEHIFKDFKTIRSFITRYQYEAGLFILYNHSFQELMQKMGDRIRRLKRFPRSDAVYIITIKRAGIDCEEHKLSEI